MHGLNEARTTILSRPVHSTDLLWFGCARRHSLPPHNEWVKYTHKPMPSPLGKVSTKSTEEAFNAKSALEQIQISARARKPISARTRERACGNFIGTGSHPAEISLPAEASPPIYPNRPSKNGSVSSPASSLKRLPVLLAAACAFCSYTARRHRSCSISAIA